MVSREREFAECLERVRRTAGEQGNRIGEEQVREVFSGLDLSESQLQMVFDYLEKHSVGIGEPGNPQEPLTREEQDYLQLYLDSLERLPVCSQGERRAWAMGAMAGDREAGRCLAEACLQQVVDIARLYTGQGVLLEDLIGEGNAALFAGVETLGSGPEGTGDPSQAEKKLAGLIMDAMEELIRENEDQEKTDRKIAAKVNRVADKAKELAGELGRKVTPRELMQESGMSLKSIQEAMRMSGYKIEDIEYAEDSL